jgi:hypothetical protein
LANQAFTAAILAVRHQQIEGEKAWIIAAMEEQIRKLWPSAFVQ